jgi:hypothetical protein
MKLNQVKLLGLGLALAASSALATPVALTPGGAVSLTGSSSAIPGSAPIATLLNQAFVPTGGSALTGFVDTYVYNNDPANPFGATGLTFRYTIRPVSDMIHGETTVAWGGVPLYVDNMANDGVPSEGAYRSAGNGATVGFQWALGTPIPAGHTGSVLVYTPNAPISIANMNLIDGGTAIASCLAVPEPTTMAAGAMLLLPFAASTLRMIRRKNA